MRKRLGKQIFDPSQGQVARTESHHHLKPFPMPAAWPLDGPGGQWPKPKVWPLLPVSRVLHLISAGAHMDSWCETPPGPWYSRKATKLGVMGPSSC